MRMPEPKPASSAPHRKGKDQPTILIVDDSPALRNVLGELLRAHGYHVCIASDGIEAMAIIDKDHPDLALVDLRMPERDGWSVLAELRSRDASLPVIIMSGGVSDEDIEEALRQGACACLSKPFQIHDLLSEIEKVIGSQS